MTYIQLANLDNSIEKNVKENKRQHLAVTPEF